MNRRITSAIVFLSVAVATVAVAVPPPDIPSPSAEQLVEVPARGELEPPAGDPPVVLLLSGIDFIPVKNSLDATLGALPDETLVAIARNGTPTSDPGVRIRAYRALAFYETDFARAQLALAVEEHGDGTDTLDNLYLRAAMDSLATAAGAASVSDLIPHLSHASRDVRAAAARALATCGSPIAVDPLRARLSVEPEDQVKAAISKAIRELDSD